VSAIDAIRARLTAATPGPWAVEHDNNDDYEAGITYGDFPNYIRGPRNVSLTAAELKSDFWKEYEFRIHEVSELSEDDAQFIAHARDDVPRLLTEEATLYGMVWWLAHNLSNKSDSSAAEWVAAAERNHQSGTNRSPRGASATRRRNEEDAA
jgi:hypothetical protein